MIRKEYIKKASTYLNSFCNVKPNRRTGSAGNREATDFFARILDQFGYDVDSTPFKCLDYVSRESTLISNGDSFDIQISPYSLGCDVECELVTISSIEDLESCNCENRILLMKGAIAAEQLMPKGFVFYNPDHHQRIYTLLEEKNPAGIITATEKKPDQVGALYPFPLIVDGDFDIPNIYCTEIIGEELTGRSGELFHLMIDAQRIPSTACNVIARMNPESREKIVITAHIDAYENTPGASDNASGIVVLLLLSEMISDYQGNMGIEIAAFNGEDHYSAGGQMDYLNRYGEELQDTILAINVDDVGYKVGRTAYSFYGCPADIHQKVEFAFGDYGEIIPGEDWYNGDHMIFVQNGVPSMAITAELVSELMANITHTPSDTPDILDPAKLYEAALGLKSLIASY